MENVLEACDLVKRYGALTAVDHVSLEVKSGECLALLGPNGAGKTTTVEILEGLTRPDSGTVRLFGKDLARDRRAILEETGVLLQDTNLYKKLTVRETLALFASFFKKNLPVASIIERLELSEKTNVRLEHLSGGQRQRVFIGCALINDPRFLFLDEPTTGLDPQARCMIWDLVRSLKENKRSLLLTTHYMEEAEQLADRVVVIDRGRIIADGSPTKLIREVCGGEVLRFKLAESMDQGVVRLKERLGWLNGSRTAEGFHEVLAAEPTRQLQEMCVAVDALDLKVELLEMRRSTLEDVFLKLTGRRMRDD